MTARFRNVVRLGVGAIVLGGGLLLAMSAGGPASATSSSGQSTAHVSVTNSITLSSLTSSFTLSGAPGVTVTQNEGLGVDVLVGVGVKAARGDHPLVPRLAPRHAVAPDGVGDANVRDAQVSDDG